MNVLTAKEKAIYLRNSDIYIWGGTSDTSERSQRVKRSNVPPERLPSLFWQTFRGKLFLFKIEVVTFSLLYRFSEFSRAGYIVSARNRPFFFFFSWPFFFTMVSKQHRNRLFVVKFIFEKKAFVIFLCSGCKTTNPDHFEKSCIVAVRDLVKKLRKVRNMGLSSLRKLFANIYDVGRYTRRTTKS